jgi:hypothetical protein
MPRGGDESVTRKNAHTATGTAKENVLHAAEVVAPYADSAKEQYRHLAHETRERLGPKVAELAQEAQEAYDIYLVPRMKKARAALPEDMDRAATRTAAGARKAAAYAAPRIGAAAAATKAAASAGKAAAGPAGKEAAARGGAALAALRGEVSAAEIQKLARKRQRRETVGRAARNVAVVGVVGAGVVLAWRWWDRQVNPDWLVEPPAATEVFAEDAEVRIDDDTEYLNRDARMDSADAALDPEVQVKQAETDMESEGGPEGR